MKKACKIAIPIVTLIIFIINNIEMSGALQKKSVELNEKLLHDPASVATGIIKNNVARVNLFYGIFDKQLMTYENINHIDYALELLESFYYTIDKMLRKTNELQKLENDAGKQFISSYKMSKKSLRKKRRLLRSK